MSDLLQKRVVNSEELGMLLKKRAEGEVDFFLVDVREDYEYRNGYIKGVDMLKPTTLFYEWFQEVMELSKAKTIIFTCRTAHRSGQVQSAFRANGFENTINHQGGIVAYRGEIVRK